MRRARDLAPLLDLDLDGGLAWLPNPPGARWAGFPTSYDPPPDSGSAAYSLLFTSAATCLPLLPPTTTAVGYGRQPLEKTDPARVEFVAWAVDLAGASLNGISSALHSHLDLRSSSDDAARAQGRRDQRAGRKRLHQRGVVPWQTWQDGALPEQWWTCDEFAESIAEWQRRAVLQPVACQRLSRIEMAEIEMSDPAAYSPRLVPSPGLVVMKGSRIAASAERVRVRIEQDQRLRGRLERGMEARPDSSQASRLSELHENPWTFRESESDMR